ncbi:TPA: putative sporulation protein YtxC [Clostridioides difficile]
MVEKDNISSMKFLRNNNVNDRLIYTNDIVEVVIDSAKQEVLNKKILNGTKAEQRALNIDEISTEITSMIISIMKEKLLKEYILKCYGRTYPEDKNNIYIYSLNIFAKKEIFMREIVFTRVRNYIEENDFINVEGFIRFRMREFMKYISAIGDIAVEEYLIKKDQDEFIRVLKYFIDTQEEKIDLLKVHIMEDNTFVLYDKNGNKIDSIDDEEIINMVIRENLNYEDFLISTLLTLCPKKIEILDLLNNNCSKEIIDTVEAIFENKVSIIMEN